MQAVQGPQRVPKPGSRPWVSDHAGPKCLASMPPQRRTRTGRRGRADRADCSVSARAGVEGAVLAYEKIVCSNGACPNFRLCHPVGVEPGTRIRVLEVGQELECPLGYSLVSAKVGYGN